MSKHFTTQFRVCCFVGWGCLLLTVLGGEVGWLALGSPFLWSLVFSAVDGWWPSARVNAVILSGERLVEGDELIVSVTLSAEHRVPWLEVELQLPAMMEAVDSTRQLLSLAAGESRQITFVMTAERWGVYGPEWLTLVARDNLGLTERVEHVAINQRVRVHPPTEHLRSLVPLSTTHQVTGEHRSSRRGAGSELAEVRPYRNGDQVRSIHRRLSARRGTPMVLERHPDESADIVIFVDSVQDVGEGLDTSLRWTITAAMALTKRHLRSMDRVGILDRGAGVRWFSPKLGRRALHMIVDSLLSTAVLRPRLDDGGVVPVDRIPRGATVFCVSPLNSIVVRQDLLILRQRGHRVIVIEPQVMGQKQTKSQKQTVGKNKAALRSSQASTALVLAQRLVRVRSEVGRRTLTDQGVIVIPWDPTEPLEPTLGTMGRYLNQFRGTL